MVKFLSGPPPHMEFEAASAIIMINVQISLMKRRFFKVRSFVHSFIRSFIYDRSSIRSFVRSFTIVQISFGRSFGRSHKIVHLRSFICSFIRSFIYDRSNFFRQLNSFFKRPALITLVSSLQHEERFGFIGLFWNIKFQSAFTQGVAINMGILFYSQYFVFTTQSFLLSGIIIVEVLYLKKKLRSF